MTVRKQGIHLPWWVGPLNVVCNTLNGIGVPVPGAQMLLTKGRKTGRTTKVAITPVRFEGQEYVIVGMPRAQWTFNVRANPDATLRHGRKETPVRLTEVVDDAEKRRLMRAYPTLQPLGVYPFKIMGHVDSANPEEWEAATNKVELFRIDSR